MELAAINRNAERGRLALTDQRMMFIFEGIVSSSSEDFPFSPIMTVEFRSRALVLGTIEIHASGSAAEITNVDGGLGRQFVEKARRAIARGPVTPRGHTSTQPALAPDPATASTTDNLAVLKQLAELHRDGVLSDEEFSAKKTEILRRL